MRSEVRAAALRAAAKVAFSAVFVTGCNGQADNASACSTAVECADRRNPNGPYAEALGGGDASEGSEMSGDPAEKPDASIAVGDADADAPAVDCAEMVHAAFGTDGPYPGEPKMVSAEVRDCCAVLLRADSVVTLEHRWDCCANLTPAAASEVTLACSPWGPPVPPAMPSALRALATTGVA